MLAEGIISFIGKDILTFGIPNISEKTGIVVLEGIALMFEATGIDVLDGTALIFDAIGLFVTEDNIKSGALTCLDLDGEISDSLFIPVTDCSVPRIFHCAFLFLAASYSSNLTFTFSKSSSNS